MTRTFQKTDGSIAAVLREMFLDGAFIAALNAPAPTLEKFKDPMQFVVSSMRLAYDGKTITNYRPAVGWLQQLGEPLYGRVTPDGYPLTEAAWSSSGQLVRRFEIARAIGSGNAGLFNNDDNTPGSGDGISDAHLAAVFRRDRAGARRARPRRARPHVVAAGVEHDPAGVTGLDAAVDTEDGGTSWLSPVATC